MNSLGWCEAPQAVEHPRETENPPGTPSGRRPRLEIAKPPVERLFPPFGGSLTREREGRGRNFSFTVLRLFFWLQKKRGKHRPVDGSAEEYCGVQNESKRYHWSRIQPLSHRWFLIKGIKALVCPFAVLRSRFGLRYSRVRGRRQSKFLASSSNGGARNFYPCTGEPRRLPPQSTDFSRCSNRVQG